ncbi:MAG: class I tRNA ligase family protein, partial [Acidobacteriaceae bacterium]|nr:class I tRNA ligase family protein [Acidobacteriaceae bacterium]
MERNDLRARTLNAIKAVKWMPSWGEERISNMIATRPDWCISRQRVWGVPIAVFFCADCGELLRSPEVNRAVVEMVRREGVDAWFRRDAASILPASVSCKCGSNKFKRETDIIDVWFESGSSYLAVQQNEQGFPWPSDLYTEGGDQHRGWFHSSLLCGVGVRDSAPFKMVATSGWVLDPQGRAMSKSLGNVVDPVDVAKRLGGEIVRLWVASVDFREDVHASEELMQRVAENYRKVRNTFRFVLQNLGDFDPAKNALSFHELESMDRFMLLQTAAMSDEVVRWYEEFLFHKIFQRMLNFCVVELSALYFDVLKDRLYTFAPDSKARRSAQTAIWRIGNALVRLFAPLMSFTAEEIWGFLPHTGGREESVHLARFMSSAEITGEAESPSDHESLKTDWQVLLGVREEVLKALEAARNSKLIGSGLEAAVLIRAPEPTLAILKRHERQLRYLFIVSQVTIEPAPSGNGASGLRVEVTKAQGAKCERCWNYSTRVGENQAYPTICERCSAALEEGGWIAASKG